jgi:glycosyltransferase involved in cell wall biosynthesis
MNTDNASGDRLAIVSGMPFIRAGAECYMSHAYDSLSALSRHYRTVTYVGTAGDLARLSEGWQRIDLQNVLIATVPDTCGGWARIISSIPLTFLHTARAIRKSDIVLAKLSCYHGVLGAIAGHLLRKTVVTYLICNPRFQSGSDRSFLARLKGYVRERIWIAVYRSGHVRAFQAEYWADKYLNPRRPTDTRYIGHEAPGARTSNASRNPTPGSLLFVGRLSVPKGVFDLLYAARILVEEGVEFHIDLIGSGPDSGKLRSLADELLLNDHVTFHGFIPHGEHLWRFFQNAEVFVLPTHTEAYPTVVIEALSFGLPVIATNITSIPELIRNEVNGLLVPPRCPAELASAMRRLLADKALRQKMSDNNVGAGRRYDLDAETTTLCAAVSEARAIARRRR